MAHPTWPLFDLRVVAPQLELRYIDDQLGAELAVLAAQGIHDPEFMPFARPWTDQDSPQLERSAMQYYWRTRADCTPQHWDIPLAAIYQGQLVGTTSLLADDFPQLRQFETGSWLGRAFQGRGIGKAMRHASLHLGFAGLGATLATTAAFHDNAASLGVTRSLGYTEVATLRKLRRTESSDSVAFHMPVAHWVEHLRSDDVRVHGLDAVLDLLGLETTF